MTKLLVEDNFGAQAEGDGLRKIETGELRTFALRIKNHIFLILEFFKLNGLSRIFFKLFFRV